MLWLALYFPQLPLEAFTASSYIAGDQSAQVVLEQNRVHFEQFIANEEFSDYIARKRSDVRLLLLY